MIILHLSPLTRWPAQRLGTQPCTQLAFPSLLLWARTLQGHAGHWWKQCSAPGEKPGWHRAVSHAVPDPHLPPSPRPAPSGLPPSRWAHSSPSEEPCTASLTGQALSERPCTLYHGQFSVKKKKKNYVALNVNQVPRYQKIKLSEPHWKHLQSPLEHVQCLQPPPNTLVSLQIYVRIPHLCHYSGMTKSLYHV